MRTPWRMRIYAAIACMRGDVQCARRVLPWKRKGATYKFELQGFKYHATFNTYDDNSLAEVFVAAAKTGDLLRAVNRDSAIAVSLALQFGCPVETLRDAMGRSERGEPESPIAAALDLATTGRTLT